MISINAINSCDMADSSTIKCGALIRMLQVSGLMLRNGILALSESGLQLSVIFGVLYFVMNQKINIMS